MMKRLVDRRNILFVGSCILLATLLSACAIIGINDEEESASSSTITNLGNAIRLENSVTLVCSPECSSRGFCGATSSGEQVILMNTRNPSTKTYDWFMLAQTLVTITDSRPETAVYVLNSATEVVNYYQVRNEAFEQAWVAGWCVGQ
jgi:hypothetical protein